MKTMTIEVLAGRAGKSVESVRESLAVGWTTELLALASGVSANYVCKLIRRDSLEAKRMGRDWFISRSVGDGWLEARDVRVELD